MTAPPDTKSNPQELFKAEIQRALAEDDLESLRALVPETDKPAHRRAAKTALRIFLAGYPWGLRVTAFMARRVRDSGTDLYNNPLSKELHHAKNREAVAWFLNCMPQRGGLDAEDKDRAMLNGTHLDSMAMDHASPLLMEALGVDGYRKIAPYTKKTDAYRLRPTAKLPKLDLFEQAMFAHRPLDVTNTELINTIMHGLLRTLPEFRPELLTIIDRFIKSHIHPIPAARPRFYYRDPLVWRPSPGLDQSRAIINTTRSIPAKPQPFNALQWLLATGTVFPEMLAEPWRTKVAHALTHNVILANFIERAHPEVLRKTLQVLAPELCAWRDKNKLNIVHYLISNRVISKPLLRVLLADYADCMNDAPPGQSAPLQRLPQDMIVDIERAQLRSTAKAPAQKPRKSSPVRI